MKKNAIIVTAFLISVVLLISSCQKQVDKSFIQSEEYSSVNNSNASSNKMKVYVSNLDELYAAVNNPDNTGTGIVLAPGVYVLNASYPNGGRLELQSNMSLSGQPGNPDAVLIDESALPNSSFWFTPSLATGGIRLGRGTNNLEWLSVKGGSVSVNPFSAIETDLPSTETFIGIAHVKIIGNGTRIGINIRNRLADQAGRKIYAQLEDNEITGLVNSFGFGLSFQNVNGASGCIIKVTMKQNYIHGNKIGIIVGNGATAAATGNSTIEIKSYADRLEGNGCALDPSAGVNQSLLTTSNNNTTTIKMYGTSIQGNNPAGVPQLTPVNGALPGGVYAACAYNSVNNIAGFNRASNNIMKLSFYACDISNNNGTDINAFAAWCPPATVLAGSNNLLEIYLHGISTNATVVATPSQPAEASGTNVVNVYR